MHINCMQLTVLTCALNGEWRRLLLFSSSLREPLSEPVKSQLVASPQLPVNEWRFHPLFPFFPPSFFTSFFASFFFSIFFSLRWNQQTQPTSTAHSRRAQRIWAFVLQLIAMAP